MNPNPEVPPPASGFLDDPELRNAVIEQVKLGMERKASTARKGGSLSHRSDDKASDLWAFALQILPEYSEKLDRLVQTVLLIWDRRDKKLLKNTADIPASIGRDLDPLLRIALEQLFEEFVRLSFPLEEWIQKFSAAHEEGRLTDLQRLELRLRLTELESKYKTARTIFAQLGIAIKPTRPDGNGRSPLGTGTLPNTVPP